MASNDKRDMNNLLRTLRTMKRTELAQSLAQIVDEMVAESTPDEAIEDLCSEIRKHLGISGEDARRALH